MEPTSKSLPSTVARASKGVKLNVLRSDVKSIRIVDTDFVVQLKNGKKIVIRDGAVKSMMDPEFTLAFKDVDVAASNVLQHAGPVEINEIATTQVAESGSGTGPATSATESTTASTSDAQVASAPAEDDQKVAKTSQEEAGEEDRSAGAVGIASGFSSFLPPWRVGPFGRRRCGRRRGRRSCRCNRNGVLQNRRRGGHGPRDCAGGHQGI